MNYYLKYALFLIIFVGIGCWYLTGKESLYMLPIIRSSHDVRVLFPTTAEALKIQVDEAILKAQKGIDSLIALKSKERTFENTVQALDSIGTNLSIAAHIAWTIQNVSPDESLREVAQEVIMKIQNFSVDAISHNQKVYNAIKEYAQKNAPQESLNSEEKKYLKETIEGFEKSGLNLPEAQQDSIKQIKKDLAQATLSFSMNINSDMRSIAVKREDLAGLDENFIAELQQNPEGLSILGVDYPTYFAVMDNCSVESTRCALWKEFNNRAYPANEAVLKTIIALRDRLAKALGFTSYAHLDLDDEMAKTPERVHQFLESLITKSQEKIEAEMALLKTHLPQGVVLLEKGAEARFKPWDFPYVKSNYKKQHLALDDEKIKEYFPVQKTVNELLDIYAQFLNIEFRQEPLDGMWHPDVRYVAVYTRQNQLLGHLLLDLHPRPHKYGHACMSDLVPAVREKNGTYHPPVILVIANFPKPTASQPGLLRFDDVKTFFHEFGHAMHGLFGATQMAGFSGTNVKTDFVEMPSQMLEEWMYDPMILKKMSSHYITNQPLDDATIEKIRAVKQFGTGTFVQRQSALALLALACFASGEDKNPSALRKEIFDRLFSRDMVMDVADHFEASFGHLSGYGAKYYSYLWSKVFALDMFDYIKQYGLLNSTIGQHYIDTVISKGGSVEPDEILVNFLGRAPNMNAFLKDLGL